jgi:hypothetical protein
MMSFDLRPSRVPSPKERFKDSVVMPCAALRTLRRTLAAPRSRSAMHAIDGVRGAVTVVRRSTVSRNFGGRSAISAHPITPGRP